MSRCPLSQLLSIRFAQVFGQSPILTLGCSVTRDTSSELWKCGCFLPYRFGFFEFGRLYASVPFPKSFILRLCLGVDPFIFYTPRVFPLARRTACDYQFVGVVPPSDIESVFTLLGIPPREATGRGAAYTSPREFQRGRLFSLT